LVVSQRKTGADTQREVSDLHVVRWCGRWTRGRPVSSVCAHRGPGCGIWETKSRFKALRVQRPASPSCVYGEPITISIQGEEGC
jgi:hypothetical protein